MTCFNVALSSAGRRVALLDIFRDTLQQLGLDGTVIAFDKSPLAPAVLKADRSYLVPPCTSPSFAPVICDLCAHERIHLLVPTIDTELPILSQLRGQLLTVGTTVLVSDQTTVAISADKVLTHDWLLHAGLPTVAQVQLESEAPSAMPLPPPFVVKPRFGSASTDVSVVTDMDDLRAALRRRSDLIAQEIAHGSEFTIDILANKHGVCTCAVPRQRIEVRAGEVSKAVTRRIPELIEVAYAACASLPGPVGPLTLQVFFDEETRDLKIIELNPRFAGGYPLSWRAGARYPQWIIQDLLNLATDPMTSQWADDVVMVRYDEAVFVDRTDIDL